MIRTETGTVVEIRTGWSGVSRAWVEREADASRVSAISYLEVSGPLTVGDTVLMNTNALDRGLGTGGEAFVIAVVDKAGRGAGTAVGDGEREAAASLGPGSPSRPADPVGHMVKARYMPHQMMVDALDDPASPHHAAVNAVESLAGLPVVIADLHSSLAPIVAGIRLALPAATIAYIHTDWAALPVAFSRQNATLREHGLLDATISTGQSFGGDLEAVALPSALAGAAAVVGADVAIVAQGPGNLGTGTRWGFSGIAAGEALATVDLMGGSPVAALRVSEADARPRHWGLSHHSSHILGALCSRSATLPVPAHNARGEVDDAVLASIDNLARERSEHSLPAHDVQDVEVSGLDDALRGLPVHLSTMGRGLDDDRAAFVYAALAGRYAGELASGRSSTAESGH